jgi:hypothetical protein
LFMRYLWICLFYFFFESSARKSFDEFVGAYLLPAASYFLFPIVK